MAKNELHYELLAHDRRAGISPPITRVVYRPEARGTDAWTTYCGRFLFILRGEGIHECRGRRLGITAPTVVTQKPGSTFTYGPCENTTWDELLIAYDPHLWPSWRETGLVGDPVSITRIDDDRFLRLNIRELLDRLAVADTPFQLDMIDHLCERLVLSSHVQLPTDLVSGGVEHAPDKISRVRTYLRKHFSASVDVGDLAAAFGMSPSNFRRRWKQRMGISPLDYVTQLRMAEACRRLMSSDETVAEVAKAVGYADPYYFSRLFRRRIGIPPGAYRHRS